MLSHIIRSCLNSQKTTFRCTNVQSFRGADCDSIKRKSRISQQFNKPWFDDECSKLIDEQEEAKLQWLQNLSQISGDNLQNIRHEISRTFRN
jgi:hypothetical protein